MSMLRQSLVCWVQTSILWLFSSLTFAQTFDQSYQSWKTQQQLYDQRLNTAPSANDYDGKRILQKDASQRGEKKHIDHRININTATVLELQQLSGIGEKKAKAIVDYRNQNGRFKTVNDLLNIKGIGPKFIEKNKSNLGL